MAGAGPPICRRCFAGNAVCIPLEQCHRRGLDFHALLTCKPPAQGHRAEKVWGQPSLPGNPAPRPTKLSKIWSSAHRDKFYSVTSPRGKAQRSKDTVPTPACLVTKLDRSHSADPERLRASLYYVS